MPSPQIAKTERRKQNPGGQRHPTHRTSIQVLLTAAVSSSLTLQDGTTICLHTVIFKLSMSFVPSNVLSIVVSILQINAKKILRPSCIAIVPIEPSLFPSLSDTDPERPRAPAARGRPGGPSSPILHLCSYPRRGQATHAQTELGELLRPEQIYRCVTCVVAAVSNPPREQTLFQLRHVPKTQGS